MDAIQGQGVIKGIIFDKDGTLFDFNATWAAWAQQMLTAEAGDDRGRFAALAEILGYDVANHRFLPGSIVIAETVDVVADHMLRVLTDVPKDVLKARMNAAATQVPQIEVTPLVPLFDRMRGLGLRLGVATNDAAAPALRHLERAGITGHLDFIAGYDSGFGAKPAAGQLHAFCAATGLAAGSCVMVGDSLHDLHAGRAAQMITLGVLTGPAKAHELAPFAHAVLPTIADIPDWLVAQNLA